MNVVRREPALIAGLVSALLALVVAFGAHLSTDQVGAVWGVASAVLAVIVRSRVTPAPPALDVPKTGGGAP